MQPPSSSVTADTVSPLTSTEAGRGELITSRNGKRKRTMAGYTVEQTATGTGAFPPHKQQPESEAIPPIKLRRVTEKSLGIVCSSASVQGSPEPMEDAPFTTEINSETSISEFTVSQQKELRTQLNNQERQAVLKNVGILLKTLNDRKIKLAKDRGRPPTHSLFSKLKDLSIVNDAQIFKGYFAKANTFFLAVNTEQIKNTGCLTSMLKSKAQIQAFAKKNEEDIQAIAANPYLKRISSMCNGRGIPAAKEVNDFVGLEVFKGEGRTLLPSISSMRCGKGIPTAKEVNDFVGLAVFKGEGRTLLPSISSMCHRRGIPAAKEVNDFVGLEVFKGEGRTLLPSISSMCNGRGIPTSKEVNDFVGLEVFKGEGRTLLPSISSMCHNRGIPTAKEVNDFVGLAVFKGEGRTLLPSISSMRSGKGIPTAKEVNDFVGLEVFKGEGRTLLPSISSMCHSRGIPTAKEVNDFVGLAVFKGEGRTLLPSISSMCHNRGIPTAKEVNDFVGLAVFKGEGRTLLPSISSMRSGKGIPTAKEVNDFVGLAVFKGEGRTLLPSISSMCNGRGIPTAKEVNDFVGLAVFKGEGRTLLPSISSMCNGRGIPTAKEVNDFVGLAVFKGEGRTLLPSISSMRCGKGIPTAKEVNDFVGLAVFKGEGRALLPSISSMCHRRGIPTAKEVNDFVGLEVFKGEGRTLLPSISSMCNGRGIPTAKEVNDFVRWLPSDEKKSLLKHSCRIFASIGLPSGEKLSANKTALRHCLNQHGCTTEYGDDNSDEDDDPLESSQIKALALFLSGPAKWRINIAEFQQYLTASKSSRNDRASVRAALKSLLPILAIHGGAGIQFWIEKHREDLLCKGVLTKALSTPAPLALTKFALTQLPESEMQEYLELCRNLNPAPTQKQWHTLKPLRQQLGERFEYTLTKRIMLEILWQQSADNRSKYADKMDELFKTVPTISQWGGLHQALGPQKMQQFMDACLDYQATPETAPDVTIQQRLLEGMLLANHSLPEQEKIPDLCFSNRVSTDDKRGVIVDGDHVMSGQIRLWRFITAMLIELEQTEYQFKHQRLTILPADGEPVLLQNPEFTLTDTGFVIKNWTPEQLTAFFRATEFTEQWYKKPQDKRELCAIRLEAKLAQMRERARTKKPEKSEPKKIPHLLAPSLIISLINGNKPLKSAVWSSLEHYASNGQLIASLCTALSPVIKDDKDGTVTDLVKNAVIAKLQQIEAAKTPVVTSIPQQGLPARASIPTFDAAIAKLNDFRELGNAELELLEPYRGEMGFQHLMSISTKINHHSVDKQTQNAWRTAFEHRKKDPLGLNDIWEPDFELLPTEPELANNNHDWLEELLQ